MVIIQGMSGSYAGLPALSPWPTTTVSLGFLAGQVVSLYRAKKAPLFQVKLFWVVFYSSTSVKGPALMGTGSVLYPGFLRPTGLPASTLCCSLCYSYCPLPSQHAPS